MLRLCVEPGPHTTGGAGSQQVMSQLTTGIINPFRQSSLGSVSYIDELDLSK